MNKMGGRMALGMRHWLKRGNGEWKLDIQEATRGGRLTRDGFEFNRTPCLFTWRSMYRGTQFKGVYTSRGQTIMRVNETLKPGDGSIDVWVIPRYDGACWVTYFLVDDDWKSRLPNTRIFWGKSYEREKPFAFHPLVPGVTCDVVFDDPGRIELGLRGCTSPGPLLGVMKARTGEGDLCPPRLRA